MPQLDISTFSSQIFWLVVCLVALYCSLQYHFVPKIKKLIDTRAAKISQQALEIEKIKSKILQLQQEYNNTIINAQAEAIAQQQQQLRQFEQNCENNLNILLQQQRIELLAIKTELNKERERVISQFTTEVTSLENQFINQLEKFKLDKI